MSNLLNEFNQHLTNDLIMQLSRQIGAQDPNRVKAASQAVGDLLLQAIQRSATNDQRGGGLMGALKNDHRGGILGDLLGVFTGQKQVDSRTMDGTGIVNHLLGKQQLEAAQLVSQHSGLDIFKSGVLMQLLAPVVMGVVGQKQQSNGLDLGGLAQILLGGGQQQNTPSGRSDSGFGRLLDMDGDGSMMDDLLNIGMKILKK